MQTYLRDGDALASTDTTCADGQCSRGCQFPACSVDHQQFATTKAADKYEKELKLIGHAIKRESF